MDEAKSIIDSFDDDGNGELNYSEFLENVMNIQDKRSLIDNAEQLDEEGPKVGYLRGGPRGFDHSVDYDPISFEWRMNEKPDFRQHVERLERRNEQYPISLSPEQIEKIIKDKVVNNCGGLNNSSALKYFGKFIQSKSLFHKNKIVPGECKEQVMTREEFKLLLNDCGVHGYSDMDSLMKRFGGRGDGTIALSALSRFILGMYSVQCFF